MARFLKHLFILLACAAIAAAAFVLWRSPDPEYTAQAWLACARYEEYDPLIADIAARHGVDPQLVKAVVWRESAFQPHKVGTSGERGLMQVGDAAAADWAKAEKVETFVPTDLFDPKTNLEVGTWYLRRAIERWKQKGNPVPFALAQYNAGYTPVNRWVAETKRADEVTAEEFVAVIDFPTTRKYIEDITARHRYYQRRGGR